MSDGFTQTVPPEFKREAVQLLESGSQPAYEIARLKRELARVTEERDILKKPLGVQSVDATLASSLSAGVSYPKIVLGR